MYCIVLHNVLKQFGFSSATQINVYFKGLFHFKVSVSHLDDVVVAFAGSRHQRRHAVSDGRGDVCAVIEKISHDLRMTEGRRQD